MRKNARKLALAAATAMVLAGAASAADLRLMPQAPGADVSAAVLPGAAAPSAGGALVPFEQSGDAMRLTGEDDTRQLSFYLSDAQARQPGSVRIAYQNAVSVLPDGAVLDVELNGHAAGSFAIRSPNGILGHDLAVTPAELVPGRNIVRLRARQHHRVDCSTAAVYELWTQVDPAASGFSTAVADGFSSVDSLLALGRSKDGFTEIRLIAGAGDRTAIARDSLKTIETLSLFLNRPDIKVIVAEAPGEGAGIDLYFGDAATYAQTPRGRQLLAAAPAGLTVRNGDAAGRATVILRGNNPASLATALLAAVNGPMRGNLDRGVLTRRHDTIVAGTADSFTLRDAGYRSAPFFGRLSRMSFNIEMPADFYPGDYGAIDFYLKGATAPGLSPGAQLLVRVNDRAATSYRFYNSEGETYDGRRRIELPLRTFHPGVNRVEVLAELPMASDAQCDSASRNEDKPRFILLDDTRIDIPALAHIGRMPDLAAFSGAAYPFSDGKPFDVMVDHDDSASLSAAMTLVSRLALSARRPLDATIRVGAADQTADRNVLILTTSAEADAADIGMDGAAPKAAGLDPLFTSAIAAPDAAAPAPKSDTLLDAFQASTALDDNRLSWKTRFVSLIAKPLPAIRQWLNYEDPADAPLAIDRADILLRLTQRQAPLGTATWTVVSADTPAALQSGVEGLTAPTVWAQLSGGTALLKKSDGAVITRLPAEYAFAEITDTSVSNLRRVAAAWFSDHFEIYVLLVVLCMGGFGWWLGYSVPRRGVRTDQ